MTYELFAHHLSPSGQLRLLLLSILMLGTSVTVQSERDIRTPIDLAANVFEEPPAYLHPRSAIGFDLAGVPVRATGVEAAVRASTQNPADLEARAHAHMSLAVYYKLHGQASRAAAEKRKGEYWLKIAKLSETMD